MGRKRILGAGVPNDERTLLMSRASILTAFSLGMDTIGC
jgi:hypothetical protein